MTITTTVTTHRRTSRVVAVLVLGAAMASAPVPGEVPIGSSEVAPGAALGRAVPPTDALHDLGVLIGRRYRCPAT